MNRRDALTAIGAIGCGGLAAGAVQADEHGHGDGKPMDATTAAPLGNHHLHFCGIHVAKNNPKFQIITQHYCGGRAGQGVEMHQCLLYDSMEKNAKLLGVEYIISDEIFRKLPEADKEGLDAGKDARF